MHASSAFTSPIQLNAGNIQSTLKSNELVFINFYADWCHFSQQLSPIIDQLSNKVAQEIKLPNKLVIARVDCDKEVSISRQYKVSKYPTLKLVRDGVEMKREYRGQRSVDALFDFLKDQMRDVITYHKADDKEETPNGKRLAIGHFTSKETTEYLAFHKVASSLRDQCYFQAFIGPKVTKQSLQYKESSDDKDSVLYSGDLTASAAVRSWLVDLCVPLVREITFANAEELTEEGLPFLILFMDPDDRESLAAFQAAVKAQLLHERNVVNFLWGNGKTFTHPLHHLGKTVQDLPVITIDSFKHMYLFPRSFKDAVSDQHLLRDFVADLHSGKLHREFHYGPDATTAPALPAAAASDNAAAKSSDESPVHVPRDGNVDETDKDPTTPPASIFKKLQPSKNRYTILKDEL